MPSKPTPLDIISQLTREEKMELLAQARRKQQRAAQLPAITEGSRVLRVPGTEGRTLSFRLSADDWAL